MIVVLTAFHYTSRIIEWVLLNATRLLLKAVKFTVEFEAFPILSIGNGMKAVVKVKPRAAIASQAQSRKDAVPSQAEGSYNTRVSMKSSVGAPERTWRCISLRLALCMEMPPVVLGVGPVLQVKRTIPHKVNEGRIGPEVSEGLKGVADSFYPFVCLVFFTGWKGSGGPSTGKESSHFCCSPQMSVLSTGL